MVYLDNSSTTKPSQMCIDIVLDTFINNWANPSSLYDFGNKAEKEIYKSKTIFAKTLKTNPNNIFFTSSGTHANNAAIFGACEKAHNKMRKLVTTAIEHKSVLSSFKTLEERGFEVVYVSPDKNGDIDINNLVSHVDSKTALVSCMHVNNETGAVVDVFKLAKMVKEKSKDTLFHCDAVQSYCKLDIDLSAGFIDFASFSGHKIFAPKGIGALYVKNCSKILNVFDTKDQELRWGTENVAFMKAFAQSGNVYYNKMEESFNHVSKLKERLISNISGMDGLAVNLPQNHMPYIVNIWVKGVKSETLLHFLASQNILISSGSACNKGKKSHVISFFEDGKNRADQSIRVSFSCNNNMGEVDLFTQKLEEAVFKLIKVR